MIVRTSPSRAHLLVSGGMQKVWKIRDPEPRGTSCTHTRRGSEELTDSPASRVPASVTLAQRMLALETKEGNAALACAVEEERHEPSTVCGHGPAVQRSAVHEVLRSPGLPLNSPARGDGSADFSGVRVHTDTTALRPAAKRAYTFGSYVVRDGRDEHTLAHAHGGNRQLKRAMFLSAFAALRDPALRTYYDKCRARGKTHTQALLRLARHRTRVLFAMLRDGT